VNWEWFRSLPCFFLFLFFKFNLRKEKGRTWKEGNVFFFQPLFNHFTTPFLYAESKKKTKHETTFNGGSLGSCIDEERSKLRYVMWIAEFSESSNLWTQLALLGIPKSMPVWVSLIFIFTFSFFFFLLLEGERERESFKGGVEILSCLLWASLSKFRCKKRKCI